MRMRKGYVLVLVCVCVMALVGCTDTSSPSGNTPTQGTTTPAADDNPNVIDGKYEIVDGQDSIKMTKDMLSVTFEGKLKNLTGKKLNYCSITLAVYDAEGNQLGTALANTNALDADGVWAFKASYLGEPDKVDSFKISEVTSF